MPASHRTIKDRIDTWFPQAKDMVRKRLQSSQTSIHLAVDIWTSPSHDLLLAICASFVDARNRFRNVLIALRPVHGHGGVSQWETLRPVLEDYGIVKHIGTLIGDNSSTNDVLCQTMAHHLGLERQINWNQTFQRIRCMGHVLNLVVKAFLFTDDSEEQMMESYDREDGSGQPLDYKGQKERANSIRAKMGVMGKVHNLVIHIRASPNRTKEFEALAGKSIPLDNRTRWNSWFRMLHVTLETQVLNALRNYAEKHILEGTIDKRDELSPSDIALSRTVEQFLSVFESATLFLEGRQATIERVLETMEIIKEHIDISLESHMANRQLKARIENAKAKFDVYAARLNQSPYYAAARILHPEHRMSWLKDKNGNPTNEYAPHKFKVQGLWEKFRRENRLFSQTYDVLYRSTHPSHRQASPPLNDFERLRQNVKEKHNRPQSQDEFENYCNEAASYDIKMPALEWWLQDTQRKRWPQLSRWAIEILSVPSMSDKPERIFSGGRRTVTWDKTSMTAATLERLECGRDWKRDDLLKDDV